MWVWYSVGLWDVVQYVCRGDHRSPVTFGLVFSTHLEYLRYISLPPRGRCHREVTEGECDMRVWVFFRPFRTPMILFLFFFKRGGSWTAPEPPLLDSPRSAFKGVHSQANEIPLENPPRLRFVCDSRLFPRLIVCAVGCIQIPRGF